LDARDISFVKSAPGGELAVGAEADDVEDSLADMMPIEATRCVAVSMGCFSG
jgi:hypothetical protein